MVLPFVASVVAEWLRRQVPPCDSSCSKNNTEFFFREKIFTTIFQRLSYKICYLSSVSFWEIGFDDACLRVKLLFDFLVKLWKKVRRWILEP